MPVPLACKLAGITESKPHMAFVPSAHLSVAITDGILEVMCSFSIVLRHLRPDVDPFISHQHPLLPLPQYSPQNCSPQNYSPQNYSPQNLSFPSRPPHQNGQQSHFAAGSAIRLTESWERLPQLKAVFFSAQIQLCFCFD